MSGCDIDITDDRSYIIQMSKREDKKEQLLQLGLAIMQEQGFNGTSVKDIVEAAGVPKGSFYTYFDSKEAFALEAIDCVANQNYQLASEYLCDTRMPPLTRLTNFFQQNADAACDGEFKVGCFMGNMCQEMADSNDTIRIAAKQALATLTNMIAEVLEEFELAAHQPGNSAAATGTSATLTAQFILNAWQGTLLRMKAEKSRQPLDTFLTMLPKIVAV